MYTNVQYTVFTRRMYCIFTTGYNELIMKSAFNIYSTFGYSQRGELFLYQGIPSDKSSEKDSWYRMMPTNTAGLGETLLISPHSQRSLYQVNAYFTVMDRDEQSNLSHNQIPHPSKRTCKTLSGGIT